MFEELPQVLLRDLGRQPLRHHGVAALGLRVQPGLCGAATLAAALCLSLPHPQPLPCIVIPVILQRRFEANFVLEGDKCQPSELFGVFVVEELDVDNLPTFLKVPTHCRLVQMTRDIADKNSQLAFGHIHFFRGLGNDLLGRFTVARLRSLICRCVFFFLGLLFFRVIRLTFSLYSTVCIPSAFRSRLCFSGPLFFSGVSCRLVRNIFCGLIQICLGLSLFLLR
mmetsp:Transcript_16542/g.41378  ORF Transcript_16542/g.41378 Transcript_16542/m.41378 type:complete len:224 (+) Transcript_16542:154-825(+)